MKIFDSQRFSWDTSGLNDGPRDFLNDAWPALQKQTRIKHDVEINYLVF